MKIYKTFKETRKYDPHNGNKKQATETAKANRCQI